MLNFLRKLRRNNINGKYLKYAIGEIILVVIGILIALGINTWNENRKDQQYLSLILKEIHQDITTDLELIYSAIEPRLEYKAIAVDSLLLLISQKPPNSEILVLQNFPKAGMSFSLTMSKGGYESLKSKGIEILRNDSLRNKIAYFYENRVPRHMIFVHENDDALDQNIDRLTTEIFNLEPNVREDGRIMLSHVPVREDLLKDQNLYLAIQIFNEDLDSKRFRIRTLKSEYLELNEVIETHLRERNISFIPFDPVNVTPNFNVTLLQKY